ncbi:hypothetical protein [Thiothrix subterranea]|uniref:Uncharacterized protein n=1 Tax=Thiothrix subterranea TaxID=2735563 RepID=A0AA51MLF1_9GAMM|nr:hypothetical protein [Thiothrix subterranea]MDQ5768057.1 hypothetical protein [Thiothrix subterranea]WML85181.1 hypothetical protein RCG00_12795 [Thiothrix subterranea]
MAGAADANACYRRLEVDRIKQTTEHLCRRIHERFPHANLLKVCHELNHQVDALKAKACWIACPNWWLRSVMLLSALLVLGTVLWFTFAPLKELLLNRVDAPGDFLQAVEAVLSGVFLLGLWILFLFTLEQRFKRSRALTAIHELRALAHVVDMHQLTKDPSYILNKAARTASSPPRNLGAFELIRYLDYCSEMLSIIGKLAAYYAQNFNDSVLYDAVNDVESLTNDLSRKIWQKIAVLHEYQQEQDENAAD